MADADKGLQLRSTVQTDDTVELSMAIVPTPEPKPEEVIVRMDASPINPSAKRLLAFRARNRGAACALSARQWHPVAGRWLHFGDT